MIFVFSAWDQITTGIPQSVAKLTVLARYMMNTITNFEVDVNEHFDEKVWKFRDMRGS